MKVKKPEIRYLYDLKKVLYDKKWFEKAENFPVYYVYREIKEKGDLRYDTTVIPPRMLGKEFPKTQGHNHLLNCPELIIVLQGRAIFFYQKCRGKKVVDVYCVRAKKGDVVVAPGDYAHFTINPGPEKLKFANWINKKNANLYDFVEKMRGACYYYTKSGWIKNKNYSQVPKLRFEKPLKEMPKSLNFLVGK